MNVDTKLSNFLESRISRYAILAGAAAAAAVPAQASIVSYVLPTPVDVRSGYSLDLDGNSTVDFYFSAFCCASGVAYASYYSPGDVAVCGSYAVAFSLGDSIGPSNNWAGFADMLAFSATGTFYLGLRLSLSGGYKYGFAQFDPFSLQGYALQNDDLDLAITTYDLTREVVIQPPSESSTPEPATGALAALALGAAAFARRRKAQ